MYNSDIGILLIALPKVASLRSSPMREVSRGPRVRIRSCVRAQIGSCSCWCDLWLTMVRDISPNVGHLGVSVKADPDILRITGLVQYTEKNPDVLDVIRQLTVYIDFQPQQNGTLILYRWHIYEIPPGGYLNNNIIRNINKRIRTCAQLGPLEVRGTE